MITIESLSNNLQELFENSDYKITAGGLLDIVSYFTSSYKNNAHDIIISKEVIDFIPCEEDNLLLDLYNLKEIKHLVLNYLNQQDIKISKCGIFIEEYQLQQIAGYYFNISKQSNILQIQIYPGDYAVSILLGGEPTIPDISKAEFIGDFDETDFKELLEQGLELPEEEFNISFPLKKPKKVGRNESCPCGSGIKYKKCCGKRV